MYPSQSVESDEDLRTELSEYEDGGLRVALVETPTREGQWILSTHTVDVER